MEFLSRSWSDANPETLHSPPSPLYSKSGTAAAAVTTRTANTNSGATPETNDVDAAAEESVTSTETCSGSTFSFASSATLQLVLERIMSQSVSFLVVSVAIQFEIIH
ncbi:hypothetical protein SSX86_018153 [Deinandra increscens subsp. villosa]|uniref:VAN3-binding protein-like auxin canalisation domain-containing protein n=1 Tax=Deinandra increscens subsp. villosa TaxID=3103831 RepID=A0AAP0C8P6_9ASTR